MALTIELEQTPRVWVMTLRGELDCATCEEFQASIERIVDSMPPATIVDMCELEYLDSSGLGLLLSLAKEIGARGGALVLVINHVVDTILSLTHLNDVLLTAPSLAEAYQIIGEARPITREAAS